MGPLLANGALCTPKRNGNSGTDCYLILLFKLCINTFLVLNAKNASHCYTKTRNCQTFKQLCSCIIVGYISFKKFRLGEVYSIQHYGIKFVSDL